MTTATGKAGKRLSAQSVDASKHPAASDAAHEGDVLDGPQDRPDRRKVRTLILLPSAPTYHFAPHSRGLTALMPHAHGPLSLPD
jgi:hypothetical protein